MHLKSWLGLAGIGLALAVGGAPAAGDEATGTDGASIGPTPRSPGLWCFSPARREAQAAYERALGDAADAERLRAFHDVLAGEPHPAGSEGDRRVIEYLAGEFERMGLEVEVQWIDVYLAEPVVGEVEIVRRGGEAVSESLPVREREVDRYSSDSRVGFGWNAFSGSGEAMGEVVYANYGTKEDFERLAEMGVECAGKIVIARYGRNYRGYKAKFAEAAGAVGLIIYNDPEDVGYVRGLMYPEGGWANETQIQRGSIKTLAYAGDPLTPGEPAIEGTERLDPEGLALPRIPVQPVGWAAAEPILAAMEGEVVPEGWQGGLPLNYRLTGGEGLRVRVRVKQERGIRRTANVVGWLRGSTHPEEMVVVGCHHDAWTHGAGDPTAGLIVVMELARTFAEMAGRGERPDRTICFAGWGAEEFGIIGSTEWVEQHAEALSESCIAYLNLDMAAMGTRFGASASPLLRGVIADAALDVEQVGRPGTSVHEAWDSRDEGRTVEQQMGSLGGGSDHVGFNCHLGIPCMSMGAGGSSGVSYHSAYDNLAWYRKVVGEDYEPAAMVTRVAQLALARLANADVLPLDVAAFADQFVGDLDALEERARTLGRAVPSSEELRRTIAQIRAAGERLRPAIDLLLREGQAFPSVLRNINRQSGRFSRSWVREAGLPERPWFRNLLVATDPASGYGSWALPELRWHVETSHSPAKAYERLTREYAGFAASLAERLESVRQESMALMPAQVDRP